MIITKIQFKLSTKNNRIASKTFITQSDTNQQLIIIANNNQNSQTKPPSQTQQQIPSTKLFVMFRNIYIEAYKNAIQQNSSLEFILIHANHIYAGLGCIMQDIQFMVGNLITQLKATAAAANSVAKTKAQGKERVSLPQKLEQISFKMPKCQFLPSSSFKSENFQYRFRINEPQQTRSNAVQTRQQAGKQKKQSFTEMFPEQQRKKRMSTENQDDGNSRGIRVSNKSSHNTPSRSPPASQQDLMDFLFNKNEKS